VTAAIPRRIAVLLNAGSGGRDKRDVAREVAEGFARHDVQPDVAIVNGGEIEARARGAIESGFDTVVAGGGDGTVSAVAAALAGSRVALGVLPLGTLNHFAKDAAIPLDLPSAIDAIAAGHAADLDTGDVNGRIFINNCSLGIYPRIVWQREQEQRKGRRKSIAFALAVVRVWREYRRVRVLIRDGESTRMVRSPFVFVGNNEYELEGVKLGARKALSRGVLHVCMAPGMTRSAVAGVLLSALAGRIDDVERFESQLTTDFTIDAWRRHLGVTLDGELFVMPAPLEFRTRPGALRVLVPAPPRT
jgi:diacylglycerol kinase family enzyme